MHAGNFCELQRPKNGRVKILNRAKKLVQDGETKGLRAKTVQICRETLCTGKEHYAFIPSKKRKATPFGESPQSCQRDRIRRLHRLGRSCQSIRSKIDLIEICGGNKEIDLSPDLLHRSRFIKDPRPQPTFQDVHDVDQLLPGS